MSTPTEATTATIRAFFISIFPISPIINEIPKLGTAATISAISEKTPSTLPVICIEIQPLYVFKLPAASPSIFPSVIGTWLMSLDWISSLWKIACCIALSELNFLATGSEDFTLTWPLLKNWLIAVLFIAELDSFPGIILPLISLVGPSVFNPLL